MKILLVCLGNICRSPIAEAVLKKLAKQHGLNWTIESAGTNRWHKGGPADERAIRVCAKNGIDLSRHVARWFSTDDFERYDVIYTMAPDVLEEMSEFVKRPEQLRVVKNFMDELYPAENRAVPDPWYDGEREFEECYRIVFEVCERIISSARSGK